MGSLLLRDVPDDVIDALSALAASAEMSREAWVREMLVALAKGATVKPRYAICFAEHGTVGAVGDAVPHECVGRLARAADGRLDASVIVNPTVAQLDAYHAARTCVARNAPGDRERAVALLARAFSVVFEVPA